MPLRYDDFLSAAAECRLAPFCPQFGALLYHPQSHGREAEWDAALAALPETSSDCFEPANAAVTIGRAGDLCITPEDFTQQLKRFSPWRKGPWNLFGITIDTEWHSDYKWQRIAPNIAPLSGRLVLDVGCGNGYYLYRMLGEGARLAIGVDPTLLYLYQFNIARRFSPDTPVFALPLKSEQLPAFELFDTVFSLGVLYHRRSPLDHLAELLSFLRPGGELVLETLVVEGGPDTVLVPEERYARMANVWFLPSTAVLETWLVRCGFVDVQTVDVTRTTVHEQRATEWMTFQSLPDFLDPNDSDLTVEGLPAPTRAIVIASKRT